MNTLIIVYYPWGHFHMPQYHFNRVKTNAFHIVYISWHHLTGLQWIGCQKTPSLGEKIQHGCLSCLGSEQPSCFSCLLILGHNFNKIWATAWHLWWDHKERAELYLISQYYGVWMWDSKHFCDQAAKGYMWCENQFSIRQVITWRESVLVLNVALIICSGLISPE